MAKKISQEKVKTPYYYVRKRLFSNKPAIFGLFIILMAVVISILGYSIMPDNTPYADDRSDYISKQPPGFKVLILKVRKNLEIKKKSFFIRTLFGQESQYQIVPILNYEIDNLTLKVKIFGHDDHEATYSVVDVVKPLFVGKTTKIDADIAGNYEVKGSNVVFIDIHGDKETISKEELLAEFKNKCLEKRTYILGTDKSGRDMLSRLLYGFRISLGIGLISVLISLLVGVTLGSLAGFFGGWIDSLVMWFMTVVWSIPGIMLVIAISLALGRGVFVAFIAIGLTTWVEIARVVRGQIMSIKQKQFVEAARAMGMRSLRIIFVHILPNIFGPLVVIMTSNFASAILTEAGLSFLGLSAQPPMPSWGGMVDEGKGYMITPGGFYLVLFPSLCIALMVLAFNLFGNGLRDAYDPKTST